MLKEHLIRNRPKAHRDTRRVRHRVGPHARDFRGEDACSGAQDELEAVVRVKLETRELGGGVVQGLRDRSEALSVPVDVKGT